MPVEIREIIIKTTLDSGAAPRTQTDMRAELATLRRELLEECERMLRTFQDRSRFDR